MVEEITADELGRRLEDGDDVQVVDIRQPDSYEAGHIPGAENVPFTVFAREIDAHEWSDDIVVVCPVGESSRQAARLLEAYEGVGEGARVANLAGGYADWDGELESDATAGE